MSARSASPPASTPSSTSSQEPIKSNLDSMDVDSVGDVVVVDSTASSPSESDDAPKRSSRSKASLSSTPTNIVVALDRRNGKTNGTRSATVSTTNSSTLSTKEPPTSSPYGTRSRNRTGGSRPNYAEDVSIDLELESSHSNVKTPSTRKSSPASTSSVSSSRNRSSEPERSTHSSNRHRSSTTNGSGNRVSKHGVAATAAAATAAAAAAAAAVVSTTSKDSIPGTSTFSAKPLAQSASASTSASTTSARKRKAPGSSHMSSANSATAQTLKAASHGLSAIAKPIKPSNMMLFENTKAMLKNGKLKADDGTVLAVDDHVYLICEPPGEPYYLGRIMEFLHAQNDPSKPIDSVRVNWYYRPRDIQRAMIDTRLIFATMHSDSCPISSLRGKCQILHRSEIDDLDDYRKSRDCFWYDRLFDRYIQRYYEVIPTSQVINVPEEVKQVLRTRWRFVVVELGQGRELTSAAKICKQCGGHCAKSDSVDCAVCKATYHMNCLDPPLTRKPQRGFAWSCGPCSRAEDRKLEARNGPRPGKTQTEEEDDVVEDDDTNGAVETTGRSTPAARYEIPTATEAQIAEARQWPYRYLGLHCRAEDALDYDDRIYPRASSRLGPRHQANVTVWHGHAVEYVKPSELKRKFPKSGKKDTKAAKEALAALEADKAAREKRPKWIMDQPLGYVHRGDDHPNESSENTARTIFKMPKVCQSSSRDDDDDDMPDIDPDTREEMVDDYMKRVRQLAEKVGVKDYNTDFLTKAIELLYKNNYDVEESLEQVALLNKRKDLKEPQLNKEELKRFEEGVAKYGSELWPVTKYVRTVKHADIVRFYYMWKKTERGKQVWGNYPGRKKSKKSNDANKLVDNVADEQDDSAFENAKAIAKKKTFVCKFCKGRHSRQWRRAPYTPIGTTMTVNNSEKNAKEKTQQAMVALCLRCAELWRKYAIEWEDVDEVSKKIAQGGGRAWKRKLDEELLKELLIVNEATKGLDDPIIDDGGACGIVPIFYSQEPPKKKTKTNHTENHSSPSAASTPHPETAVHKKKAIEKAVEQATLQAEEPKFKQLPCAVCENMELESELLCCRDCRLTVHRQCYGVSESRNAAKWCCDECINDRTPQVSSNYNCVLCPVNRTEWDLLEPAKVSHKKKTDRERDRERKERDRANEFLRIYRQERISNGQPPEPREPLKRTAHNNWMHVVCAVFTPEIKFGQAKSLEPAEGFGLIPPARFEEVCKVCNTKNGACVYCQQCNAPVHVGCAQRAGYTMGFDITPVKSTRRDFISTITLGSETGSVAAAIWCKEHSIKTVVHSMNEVTKGSDLNALQLYATNFKQADLQSLGTVRKASLVAHINRPTGQSVFSATDRRSSMSNGVCQPLLSHAGRSRRTSSASITVKTEDTLNAVDHQDLKRRQCYTCDTFVTPKWWTMPTEYHNGIHHQPLVLNGQSIYSSINGSQQSMRSLPTSPVGSPYINGERIVLPSTNRSMNHNSIRSPRYQCHKCHINKVCKPASRELPNPPSQPTPLPPVVPPPEHPPYPLLPQPGLGLPWPGPGPIPVAPTSVDGLPPRSWAPHPPDPLVNGFTSPYASVLPPPPPGLGPSPIPTSREVYPVPSPLPPMNSFDRGPNPPIPYYPNPALSLVQSPPTVHYATMSPRQEQVPLARLLDHRQSNVSNVSQYPPTPSLGSPPYQPLRREYPTLSSDRLEKNRPMSPSERLPDSIRSGSEARSFVGASSSPSLKNLLS